ncbi:MAG: cadmium-translocating P-type ATPase [Oscillospiraceae bacterium]|nr:cadmium-translocating P-type ATPase [Oscillospiraceae bacterium]
MHHHDHHSHTHDEHCGCGHIHEHDHHHDDNCGCGHDHGHEHHEDHCGCGHDHDHDHHHEDHCGCGHDHGHEHHEETKTPVVTAHPQKIFLLENLGCANCAMKMEAKIQAMEQVEYASITYATKQLRIAAAVDVQKLMPEITAIVQSIEPDVQVIPFRRQRMDAEEREIEAAKESVAVQKSIAVIAASAVTMIGGLLLHHLGLIPRSLFLLMMLFGYLLSGGDVLKEALSNIRRGQVFDENFLMSVATIGAFLIGSYEEALGVMLFYRVGELFEQIATKRSRSQIMEAVDLRPEVVNWVKGNEICVIPAENADIGDILLIRPGDRIPLDGTVVDGESFMDTSAITGEPVPVRVAAGSSVTSGWVNKDGLLKIRVEKYLEDSMVTRILDAVENAAASKPKIDKFITRFCRIYTPIVCLIALLTAVVPSLFTGNWNYWVYTALTFLVISCPCALVLSVPLAFFCGIGRGSKQGILFKGGASLEALSSIKSVAMDKTGTITKGVFHVQECVPVDGVSVNELLTLAASCEQNSTHPIAQSILQAARELNLSAETVQSVREIAGSGIEAVIHGTTVLCGNGRLMKDHGISVPDTKIRGTQVLLAKDGNYLGSIRIDDAVKNDAAEAVNALKQQGITAAMLTGDAEDNAQAVAVQVGISDVHAKLLPGEKFSALEAIRSTYGPVMFVGDGINDAPVLAGADVGAAMGSGADAAIEAADVVFMTGEVSAVPKALGIAKLTNRIAKQNVVIALGVKLAVMLLGLLGFANMWIAVFADTGVAMICIMNSIRILYRK